MLNRPTLEPDLCFLEINEGESDDLRRQMGESRLLFMLEHAGVVIHSIEIFTAGCFVIIGSHDVERLRSVVRSLNVTIRVAEHCGRITVRSKADSSTLPSLADVTMAFFAEGLSIVHAAANEREVVVIVRPDDLHSAMAIMNLVCDSSAQHVAA